MSEKFAWPPVQVAKLANLIGADPTRLAERYKVELDFAGRPHISHADAVAAYAEAKAALDADYRVRRAFNAYMSTYEDRRSEAYQRGAEVKRKQLEGITMPDADRLRMCQEAGRASLAAFEQREPLPTSMHEWAKEQRIA